MSAYVSGRHPRDISVLPLHEACNVSYLTTRERMREREIDRLDSLVIKTSKPVIMNGPSCSLLVHHNLLHGTAVRCMDIYL